MVNYFIYAKDFSGSTHDVDYYHINGLKTLDQFQRDVDKIKKEQENETTASSIESAVIYLHWGDKCWQVDEKETRNKYINRESGWLGTEPETIIVWLKNRHIPKKDDSIKLLYIITDGLIGSGSSKRCFQLNKNIHYETVVFHAINENLDEIDLSVAASFFKSQCKIYRNYELYANTNISKEYDYDKLNIDNFEIEKDELTSYIRFKFIKNMKQDGAALHEIDNLKKLRNRLFTELSLKSETTINVSLDTKYRNVFLREFVNTGWYKDLTGAAYGNKAYIEKSISTLINYITAETKSYSFDALKFNMKFDRPVEEEPIVNADFTAEQQIDFPDIILDDDKGIPVIILTEVNLINKVIFHEMKESSRQVSPASFTKFKSTMECPLFLINDHDIRESIGYFYTYNVYKQFLANNTKSEPRTRKTFHGGLVLTDTDQFDKYNDYILSATYFDSKKVNLNVGLFYFVLWKNCENKEWMDRNVVEQFKKYTMRRISETVCKIGLSSLPLDTQENTSLLTALWYCLELSSCIFKNDPQNYKQERLRMYHGVSRYMIEILTYFNYDLDLKTIKKRRELISYVMNLKKIQKYREKVYYLLEKIFKTVDGFLVSDIEKPFNLYFLNYLKYNHKEILCDEILEEKVCLNDYVHLMYMEGDLDSSKARKGTFEICKKTYRPFFAIDENNSFYTELVKNTKKTVINDNENTIKVTYEPIDSLEFDKILSRYKLFINCVKYFDKYPTLNEYIGYVSNKHKYNGDLVTIFPPNVYFDLKNVYECYQKIIANVEVKEFIAVCRSSVDRANRIKAEERLEFDSDFKLNEFLSTQELKVDLKRKARERVVKKIIKPNNGAEQSTNRTMRNTNYNSRVHFRNRPRIIDRNVYRQRDYSDYEIIEYIPFNLKKKTKEPPKKAKTLICGTSKLNIHALIKPNKPRVYRSERDIREFTSKGFRTRFQSNH